MGEKQLLAGTATAGICSSGRPPLWLIFPEKVNHSAQVALSTLMKSEDVSSVIHFMIGSDELVLSR